MRYTKWAISHYATWSSRWEAGLYWTLTGYRRTQPTGRWRWSLADCVEFTTRRYWSRHSLPLTTRTPDLTSPWRHHDVTMTSPWSVSQSADKNSSLNVIQVWPHSYHKNKWMNEQEVLRDNPVNPDFQLRTPGYGRWSGQRSGSSPKLNSLVPWPCPTPPRNFVKIRLQLFQLSGGQTNRPKWKHNLRRRR